MWAECGDTRGGEHDARGKHSHRTAGTTLGKGIESVVPAQRSVAGKGSSSAVEERRQVGNGAEGYERERERGREREHDR